MEAWGLLLSGVGTFLIGLAAVLALSIELGSKRKLRKANEALENLLVQYRRYMAGEEGIVLKDYPSNADRIISKISTETGLSKDMVKAFLDKLKREGRI